MNGYQGRILGELPSTCYKDENYFYDRFCFIDCRGPLTIHENSFFGFGVKIITLSHDTSKWPVLGNAENKGVVIEDGAWICSFSILYNCKIGKHAIVSIGSVVNGITVPDYGLIVGNPGKLVGFMHEGHVIPLRPDYYDSDF